MKKLWVDDKRDPKGEGHPDAFWVKTSKRAIAALEADTYDWVSLDHDLGGNDTGYKVIVYLENRANEGGAIPTHLGCHSQNPVGKQNILDAIAAIRRRSG